MLFGGNGGADSLSGEDGDDRIQGDGGDGSAPTIANAAELHHQVDRIQLRWFRYLIERLEPRTVIPGHGPVFHDAERALTVARKRLDGFASNPVKHALYAAKVLLKYKLLEWQRIELTDLHAWASATPYFGALHARHFGAQPQAQWLQGLADDLVRSGAARREGDGLVNL